MQLKVTVLVQMGGGRNIKFHYYDWPFFSLHRKCLFSSSLLRNQNIENGFLVDQNIKNQFITTTTKIQTFDVLILPMASKKIRTLKIKKHQLPMAYYLWLPRPVGGQVRVNQVRLGLVRLGQSRLGSITLSQVRLGQVRSGQRAFKDLFF